MRQDIPNKLDLRVTYIQTIRSFNPEAVAEGRRKWLADPVTDFARNNFFFEKLNLEGVDRVLEIGCGTGVLTSLLNALDLKKLVGLDQPDEFYKTCREAMGVESLVQYQRIQPKEPLEVKGKFDLICGIGLWFLEEFDEESLAFFYEDCQRLLKKDGTVQFFVSREYEPTVEEAEEKVKKEKAKK